MSSPSALIKINYLVIRHLHFESVLGDLQEGNGCASRCQLPLFPSTKSAFLCAFALRNPHFRPFRAQNRGFCVRKGNFSPVLPPFEHKIGFFVSKWAIFPRFWVVLTQNRHFCARGWLPRVQQCPLKPSRAHRSSAPPATSPAGCILQQCARQ